MQYLLNGLQLVEPNLLQSIKREKALHLVEYSLQQDEEWVQAGIVGRNIKQDNRYIVIFTGTKPGLMKVEDKVEETFVEIVDAWSVSP